MRREFLSNIWITSFTIFIYTAISIISFLFEKMLSSETQTYVIRFVASLLSVVPLFFLKKHISKNFPFPISKIKWSFSTLAIGCILGLLIAIVAMLPQLLTAKIQCCSYYRGWSGYLLAVAEIFVQACQEEVCFRVLFIALFIAIFRSIPLAILLQAILFGVSHEKFYWEDLDRVLYFLLPAILLALVFCLSNDLALISGLHFGMNWGISIFFIFTSYF
jgi:hypothetical protein